MKAFSFILILSVLGLMTACGSKLEKNQKPFKLRHSLIHPLYFQEEIAANINFPFWFNDSLIRSNNIKKLTITYFSGTLADSLENDESTLAKRAISYSFNSEGQVLAIQITDFSEGIIISNQSFEVEKSNESGYCKVIQKDNQYGIENSTFIYKPTKKSPAYEAYQSATSMDLLHYITNKKFFGPLSVDSIAHPLSNDWIILGTPDRPVKRYKVQNKVKERMITTFSYVKENYPKRIEHEDYPFIRKRSFRYKEGLFSGYVDSTFIDNTFVTSVRTKVYYDQQVLPIKIEHQKEHAEGKNNFQSHEIINYVYFK